MLDVNIQFIEEYKRLDILCKDILQSEDGISSYIDQMGATAPVKTMRIPNWDKTFKTIKHLRWMRNQLVHEISFYDDFCTIDDIKDIKNLYNDLLNAKDPLSLALNIKQVNTHPKNDENAENQTSLWDKIVSKVKNFFSRF